MLGNLIGAGAPAGLLQSPDEEQSMAISKPAALLSALFFMMPHMAHADARAEIRARCEADVKANCGMVFSRDKALACLIENKSKLSGPCSTALSKASCDARAPGNIKAAFACPG